MGLNRLLVFAFTVLIIFSCSAQTPDSLEFSKDNITLSPGETSELVLYPVKNGERSSDFTTLKELSLSFQVNSEVVDHQSFSAGNLLTIKNYEAVSEQSEFRIEIEAADTVMSGSTAELTVTAGEYQASAFFYIKKDPDSYINNEGIVTDAEALDTLVNKNRRLPGDYVPADLVKISVPTILSFEEVNHLRKEAAEALADLFDAAKLSGYDLYARSGYRAYRTQVGLYEANVRKYGKEYADTISAKPGTSEHQSGLAMDISCPEMNYQLEQSFGKTDPGIWVRENAHSFGFIIRYPEDKQEITGYTYEPWHLRFIGKTIATEIFENGLCLEEYFQSR